MAPRRTARARNLAAVTGRPLRCVLYLRISSDRDGDEAGVTRQREDCQARAAREGWTIVREYCDNDPGASTRSRKGRPDWDTMIAAAKRGEFDVILAYSNSRLTRRPLEFEALINLHEGFGTRIVTIVSGDDDLSTADGRMVARFKAVADAGEAERIAERVSRAARQRAEQGRPNGGGPAGRPFGFERDAVTHRAAEADALRHAVRTVINGGSVRSIVAAWNAAGITTVTGRQWQTSQLRDVFIRARNAGLMDSGVRAVWEPIITREEHDAVVTILTDPARLTHRGVSRRLVGSGIYRCGGCGSPMRSGGNGARGQARYGCSGVRQCSRRSAAMIDDLVRSVVVAYLRRENVELLRTDDRPDLVEERARMSALRAVARELPGLVGAGIMSVAEFRVAKDRNEAEIAALSAVVERATGVTPLAGIADAADAGDAFLGADLDRQRAVIDAVATVTVLPSKWGRRPFAPESVKIEWKGDDR